jgi:Raf kinase inhibitor-like YbhB/YbcL family protein
MYRCGSVNISPPLGWTPGPAGTKSYAVVMAHTTSLHWILWDISPEITSLPEKIERAAEPPIPAGGKQVKPNLDGATWFGYTGPCPHGANQRYDYFVYALDVATLGVAPLATTKSGEVDALLQKHKLARATLLGMASQ